MTMISVLYANNRISNRKLLLLIKLWFYKRLFFVFLVTLFVFGLFVKKFELNSETKCLLSESFYVVKSYSQRKNVLNLAGSKLTKVADICFPLNATIYTDGVAYDFYSVGEFQKNRPGPQWLTFPLPGEKNSVDPWIPKYQSSRTFPCYKSPPTASGLAYVDRIYVISDFQLKDRLDNIKRMFARHNLPVSSIHWRIGKWTRATCTSKEHKDEVYQTLNLEDGPLGDEQAHRYCALTMKHVKIWKEIANRHSILSLILEDDAIFVPFFKEKFDRFVYTAIRTGALKTDPTNCAPVGINISENEWIEQNPAFVIGTCVNILDPSFPFNVSSASPRLTTHKEKFSRCAHAYLLTSCSAQALLQQLYARKYKFLVIDWLQSYLGRLSPTLQPFWLDPPIVYQGNMALDLDGIPSFRRSTP